MEVDNGLLTDGQRYINQAPQLARREQQVARGGENQGYGMGLKIDRNKGTPVVWHGGSMAGYQAEISWLPEHNVGVVLLINANAGAYIRGLFQRRLIEVLFDAEQQAVKNMVTQSKSLKEDIAAERKTFTLPAIRPCSMRWPRIIAALSSAQLKCCARALRPGWISAIGKAKLRLNPTKMARTCWFPSRPEYAARVMTLSSPTNPATEPWSCATSNESMFSTK